MGAPTNCEGYEDADFVVIGGNSPDTIPIPGEISMDINQLIKVDLPSDLVIKMDLTKLDPFPLTVPCLNGLGSCEYDFCQILVDNGDQLCDQLPEGQPCGCPLLANTWDLKGVKVPVPDFGIVNKHDREITATCIFLLWRALDWLLEGLRANGY